MHPQIHEFWEKNGYRLRFMKSTGMWIAEKDKAITVNVAYRSFLTISKNNHPDFYLWNEEQVSEEYMLKIVKMKAFI